MKLVQIYNQNKYSHVYILDKVNKPAIAGKISGIKNIIGPGIGNQKKYLTTDIILNDNDWKLNYSEQSKKLLKLHKINLNNPYPQLNINIKEFNEINSDLLYKGKKIAFGVDSFEDYKMWYEEDFVKLAELLHKKNIFDYIYLICGPDKSHITKKIIEISKKDYFIDCSKKDLTGVITAIKNSQFYVGNNSGPLNLSAALGIESFGLIVNDAISELKYSKIQFITPKNYKDNTWIRDRKNMKTLTPDEVFNFLKDKMR